jgi:membrane protease YdiL (CAAX protease family)
VSSVVWLFILVLTRNAPIIRLLKRKPHEIERVEFSDVVESMAIILTPTIALSFIFLPTGLSREQITPYHVFITSILTAICIAGYLYLVIIRPRVFTLRQLGIRKIDREDLGKAGVLFLFVSVLIVIVETLLERVGIPLQQYSFGTKEGAVYAFIAVVGITPIAEELYFRGFLFKGLRLHNPSWIAYLVSALLFAVLHPPLIVMLEVFIIGLLLAYIVQETKSIWPGVLIHMINNAIVFGYLLYR